MIALVVAAAAVAPIEYRVSVTDDGALPNVMIAMTFRGDADGVTDIDLPDKWSGSPELWRNLSPPAITGGQLIPAKTPNQWRIAHRPNARLTVRYTIKDAYPGVPDANFDKAAPVVERDWFHLLGQGVIAIPNGRDHAPATFAWGPIAKGWRVASDVERTATPLTPDGMADSVIIGGTALRIVTREVGSEPLRVAALGSWPYTDDALADAVARLERVENAMLAARPVPFLVTLMPLTGAERGAQSYGGTGRTAGFQLASTANIGLPELTRTLAHEYAHRWFGKAFGAVEEGAGPYWFTEGANDWFAARAMVVSGLWTTRDWVASLNEMLMRYGSSTARDMNDAEITAAFWTNPDAMQVQYDRGHLTTLLLDRALKGQVIDVLREMASQPSHEDQVARFTAAVEARGPGELAAARKAAASPLPADALAPCGTIATITQPRYDRGYDLDDKNVVTKVRTAAAREAGIRVGMQVIKRLAFTPGDSAGLYTVRFADGAAEKTLSWYPRGDTMVTFQRLDPTAADIAACHTLVAGARPTP